jgi:DNA-binding transcriptional LysR family regulator
MLDPRRVLTFREVANLGSFSRAAESLSLTQSAVSQQVASLEREAGTRLLDRGRGGLRPTPAGERLLAHAQVIAERLRLADAQVAELAAQAAGELKVGAFPSALATIVPTALTRLLRRRPDLRVAVREGLMDDLAAGVRDGRLHLAVCFQDAAAARREHEGLARHDVVDEPMVAALPPRHRLARRRVVDLAELAGETWTAPSHDGLVARTCRAAGFEPDIRFLASDPLAIRGLVAAGLAVTVTSRLLAGELHGVRIAELDGAPARRVVYALLPDAGARTVAHEMVRELVAAASRASPGTPAPAASGRGPARPR